MRLAQRTKIGGCRGRAAAKVSPTGSARRLPRQRSPDRQASIERRRNLSTEVPRPIRARYTEGQAAALAVIGQEVQKHGYCDKSVPEIAARAGVCERIVQEATQLAKEDRHITVEYRRRSPFRNDTNVIHIVAEYLGGADGRNTRSARPRRKQAPTRMAGGPAA
jgi:hypothetical protein